MIENFKKLSEEYQTSIIKGVDALFAMQKQVMESTFDIYEKSLVLREDGYSKTKDRVEEVSALVEKSLSTGQEKLRASVDKFVEKYLPDKKDQIEKAEQIIQDNVTRITDQLKEVLTDNVDSNVKKVFQFEREFLDKAKELFLQNINNYQTQVHALLGINQEAGQ